MTDAALETLLSGVRAAGDHSRLRLLAACAAGEWTVSELVQVLGQSQPRISRHLKMLADAGLLERFREGSWVFYRRARYGDGARLAQALIELLPSQDPILDLDRQRLAVVREARRAQADLYFNERARDWDSEFNLSFDGRRVEAHLVEHFERIHAPELLDIGTGTGRVLELLSPHVRSAVGIDINRAMLSVARANLDRISARNCQIRHGDMYSLPSPDASFDAVTLHQVLHFADDPKLVLSEARRVLRTGGTLVVVDLEQHEQEWLRSEKRHRRLGFSRDEMADWFLELGLVPGDPRVVHGAELSVAIWTGGLTPKSASVAHHISTGERVVA